MRYVEALGIAFLTASIIVLVGLVLVFARRELIARRGGTIGMSMRLSTYVPGRGWAAGMGRFTGDQLRWYRLFSLALRPRRVLSRHDLTVVDRRSPEGPERLAVPEGWVVLRCRGTRESAYSLGRKSEAPLELALDRSAVSGFLSWIESAPPRALRRT